LRTDQYYRGASAARQRQDAGSAAQIWVQLTSGRRAQCIRQRGGKRT
jgi:hypothetical protein